MAFDDDLPMWLENVGQKYNAREYRRLLFELAGGHVGRFRGLAVRASSPAAMTVKLTDGSGLIPATTGTSEGFYFARNVGDILDVPVLPADPSTARWDLAGLWVRDSEHDGGGLDNSATLPLFQIIPGTVPATLPAAPDNFYPLAKIVVGAGVTSITNGNITDLGGDTRREYEVSPQTLTWAPQTTDSDLTTFVATAQPDWIANAHSRLSLCIKAGDAVAWDLELEVWTGAGGTGTKLGSAGMRNPGNGIARAVHIDCDEFGITPGATQTFRLRANYSAATPTTGFSPASIGENVARVHLRPA